MSWKCICRYAFKPVILGTHHVKTVIILGLASRSCNGDPAVWQDPNVENCSTEDINQIRNDVNNLNNASNLTLSIQSITEELARATEKNTTSIFPKDLQSAINITRDIIK